MVQTDGSNTLFKLAADFVNNTTRHIFLTGKAGTGKTTFLKYIKEHTRKNTVVVAPTGVAAINAGGVTMHSFFQLPFGPFIPGNSRGFSHDANNVSDKNSLFKNIRFNADKRELLEQLELLIIDEISMVRADMLDAMDAILRHFRKKTQLPFGGVQVLYIGDMYQLPPVVSDNEWEILQPWYESPFFFSSQAVVAAPPLYIELKKIYRQNEALFIEVLNRVRNNQVREEDFLLLNNRYLPNFAPPAEDKYITLSTHNKRADAINTSELEKLPGKMLVFTGSVNGDFSDKALPTEMSLQLKEGAQVMFIKNDSGTDRKYFNGKLATIKKINQEEIIVISNTDQEELKVEKETWRNVRYSFDKASDRIKEEELGSFTQYPIKLAWAITIHKSQGLTFDKAIIDAGASFAAGQVYVALSRCSSIQGMVLLSRLHASAIATDARVIAFAQKEAAADELYQVLQQEQQHFWAFQLLKSFDWQRVNNIILLLQEAAPKNKLSNSKTALLLAQALLNKTREQALVAEKFQQQLQLLLPAAQQTGDMTILADRVNKAIAYFAKSIGDDLLKPLREHITSLQYISKAKKYALQVAGIETMLSQHLQKLVNTSYGDILLCKEPASYAQYYSKIAVATTDPVTGKGKPVKGSSQAETFALFRNGKTITEIASLRELAESTVYGHLSGFVKTGELNVLELLTEEKLHIILPVVKELGGDAVSPVKEILGDQFSFTDIRIVLNHWYWLQQQSVNA